MSKKNITIFIILIDSLLSLPLEATETLRLNEETTYYSINTLLPYWNILHDPTRQWTIEKVASDEMREQFVPVTQKDKHQLYFNQTIWLRLQLKNTTEKSVTYLLKTVTLEQITFYSFGSNGQFNVKRAWINSPGFQREFFYHLPLFSISLPPDSQKTIYLQVQDSLLGFRYIQPELWLDSAFWQYNYFLLLGIGAFLGLVSIMIVYNLFLFFSLRDVIYFYYTLYMLCFLVLNVLASNLFFYVISSLDVNWVNISLMMLALTFVFLLQFSRHFLQTAQCCLKLDRLMLFGIAGLLIPLLSLFFFWGNPSWSYYVFLIIEILIFLSTIVLITAGIYGWIQGYRAARYFLLAVTALPVTFVLYVLPDWFILPDVFEFFGESLLYVACAWEATFLAFALADRINQLQADKARAQAQLLITTRENEQQLRQFLDAVPVGIGVLDAKGKPYFTNQKAKQLLGKGVLSHINTEQLSQMYQLYKASTGRLYPSEELTAVQALQGKQSRTEDIEIHRGDQIICVESWGTPIWDEQGQIIFAMSAFQDITERKQLERLQQAYRQTLEQEVATRTQELSDRNQELMRKNTQLDTFTRSVAHDLKNPLCAMNNFLDIVLHYGADNLNANQHNYLLRSLQTGQHMLTTIDALLLLARISRQEVTLEPLNMHDIMLQAWQQVALLCEQLDGEIIMPEEWPPVSGYAPWVLEIWVNYLSNGLKYGGKPPHLEVAALLEDDKIRFEIRDNGPGLTIQEQAQLFNPFTRLHPETAEGHGLGLSIVRSITEKLGGESGVNSQLGKGSVFYFILPCDSDN